ncbi:MAG: ABC transporter substrate-binding protein [Pseudomonadota bacterium]
MISRCAKNWIKSALLSFLFVSPLFPGPVWSKDNPSRIVSIGGSVTEIIYALGQQHRLIARDSTSLHPTEVLALPDVGYIRRLSPEGVLSVNPDLIVTLEGAGPPEAIEILRAARVKLAAIPERYDGEGIALKVDAVGAALGAEQGAARIAKQIRKEAASLRRRTQAISRKKRVLFVLSMAGGKVLASGTQTAAHGIIEMAGGTNAITAFPGYKALSDEAIITAAPDVILMMKRRGNHGVADEALKNHPVLSATPAVKNNAIIRKDGLYLLGFGPRGVQAARDLSDRLYPGKPITR